LSCLKDNQLNMAINMKLLFFFFIFIQVLALANAGYFDLYTPQRDSIYVYTFDAALCSADLTLKKCYRMGTKTFKITEVTNNFYLSTYSNLACSGKANSRLKTGPDGDSYSTVYNISKAGLKCGRESINWFRFEDTFRNKGPCDCIKNVK